MTREELYALVWSKPMVRLAKTFGISDVGSRKICIKHCIPSPSVPVADICRCRHGAQFGLRNWKCSAAADCPNLRIQATTPNMGRPSIQCPLWVEAV